MKTEDCQKLVHATLQEIPFRLIRHDDLQTKDLTAKNLIGLYAGPNKPIAALCVLDTNALCILGGGAGKMPPHIVRAAMAAGAPSEAMVQNATRFMQMAGGDLAWTARSARHRYLAPAWFRRTSRSWKNCF